MGTAGAMHSAASGASGRPLDAREIFPGNLAGEGPGPMVITIRASPSLRSHRLIHINLRSHVAGKNAIPAGIPAIHEWTAP